MSKIAVLVDAGYFWVQAGHVVVGSKSSRDSVKIDYAALRQEVLDHAIAQFPGAELLRVCWYDGPGSHGAKAPSHLAIDELDDFKLRLGTRNGYGDQKAVDGLIIADLISLAQSKAITGAILMSGDADLTPGVSAAQSLGIRVHLLSMGPTTATSPFLRAEVDHKAHWADPVVQKFASRAVRIPAPAEDVQNADHGASPACKVEPAPGAETDLTSETALAAYHSLRGEAADIRLENGMLPREVDGRLLWMARKKFGRELTDLEKRAVRKKFKELLTKQP